MSAEEKKLHPFSYVLQIIFAYIQHTGFPQINHFKQFCYIISKVSRQIKLDLFR